jgi:hypothetical protein
MIALYVRMYGGDISVNVKFLCLRVKTSKMLINKGMGVEIDTVLQLVIYGCSLYQCIANCKNKLLVLHIQIA